MRSFHLYPLASPLSASSSNIPRLQSPGHFLYPPLGAYKDIWKYRRQQCATSEPTRHFHCSTCSPPELLTALGQVEVLGGIGTAWKSGYDALAASDCLWEKSVSGVSLLTADRLLSPKTGGQHRPAGSLLFFSNKNSSHPLPLYSNIAWFMPGQPTFQSHRLSLPCSITTFTDS